LLQIRVARLDDLPAIEEMVDDFVKGHPAENHPRSADALRRAYFGERPVAHLGLPAREIVRRLPTPELSRQPAES
jgi:hypothetical protein